MDLKRKNAFVQLCQLCVGRSQEINLFVCILQESVYERLKKTGGPNPFNLFVIAEMECMHRLLACVRETLLVNEFA